MVSAGPARSGGGGREGGREGRSRSVRSRSARGAWAELRRGSLTAASAERLGPGAGRARPRGCGARPGSGAPCGAAPGVSPAVSGPRGVRAPRCPGPAVSGPRGVRAPRSRCPGPGGVGTPLCLSPAGHSDGPAGWVRLGRLQPRPLCLLHALDHRAALHRQRPRDPPVLPASGICSYHPCGSRAPAAAIYRCFYNVCHVEEQETCQEIRLKAQLRR